jgi:hypothetical protein
MAEDNEEVPRGVALVPECVECGACWLPGDERRCQLHFADIDELGWFCPDCAEREFGDDA